ncbi:MAG: hypothetical protein HYZ94_02875 [Candidatus Omnitrophica bacterium]|nr:hypothetical protein [Candidatus Omnitrophota bacterium]
MIALICFTGAMGWVFRWIPFEAGIGILLWIGIIIVAQAFQESPKRHALAVAMGLFPAMAAWGLLLVEATLRAAGTSLAALGTGPFAGQFAITGMIALERGFILTSMHWAAFTAAILDRKFLAASAWMAALALFSWIGLVHSYRLTPSGIVSPFGLSGDPTFTVAYMGITLLCLFTALYNNPHN